MVSVVLTLVLLTIGLAALVVLAVGAFIIVVATSEVVRLNKRRRRMESHPAARHWPNVRR